MVSDFKKIARISRRAYPELCWAGCSLGACPSGKYSKHGKWIRNKISKEHLLSQGLYNEEEYMVFYNGFPRLSGFEDPFKIRVKHLHAKVLCVEHNNQLSLADETAKKFRLFYQEVRNLIAIYKGCYNRPAMFPCLLKKDISLELLESWFLKTLFNFFCFSDIFIGEGGQPGIAPQELVRIVYGESKRDDLGLFLDHFPGETLNDQDVQPRGIIWVPSMDNDNKMIAAKMPFGYFKFYLILSEEFYKTDKEYLDIFGLPAPPLLRSKRFNFNVRDQQTGKIAFRGLLRTTD